MRPAVKSRIESLVDAVKQRSVDYLQNPAFYEVWNISLLSFKIQLPRESGMHPSEESGI